MLPPSAIGREIPVSARRSKFEAAPAKTVVTRAPLHGDITDDIGDGGQEVYRYVAFLLGYTLVL